MKKKIPIFKDEDEERDFWSQNDSTDYVDWDKAENVKLPNLKPSLTTISIRLPLIMLGELKCIAHKKDIPYQSLMKMYLSEKIREELRST